ncbi:MAG: bifunctional phosphoribosyl-AMP cyclohydrolase/phosphoribosyl-ATP diphosphatase HisIE [Bacteroidales bacterium]|nr:bifunctional phosphoribosyl-AMP cyclohydrolase/phosphoribosyl-ATP diphosphatase HisIE [Bacteroidales bacterium]
MKIDFEKQNGLVPAIVQDATTKKVLMLAYMDEEAYKKTIETKKVTFFSRSKNRLWTKGEESGNFLNLVEIKVDCDNDTLLVFVHPEGPSCHTGADTCWKEENEADYGFLSELERIISERKENPSDKSYTSSLFEKGINKIAQKVGEEAVELVIEAKDNDKNLFLNEGADLIYHFLVLLKAKGYTFNEIVNILIDRHK